MMALTDIIPEEKLAEWKEKLDEYRARLNDILSKARHVKEGDYVLHVDHNILAEACELLFRIGMACFHELEELGIKPSSQVYEVAEWWTKSFWTWLQQWPKRLAGDMVTAEDWNRLTEALRRLHVLTQHMLHVRARLDEAQGLEPHRACISNMLYTTVDVEGACEAIQLIALSLASNPSLSNIKIIAVSLSENPTLSGLELTSTSLSENPCLSGLELIALSLSETPCLSEVAGGS